MGMGMPLMMGGLGGMGAGMMVRLSLCFFFAFLERLLGVKLTSRFFFFRFS